MWRGLVYPTVLFCYEHKHFLSVVASFCCQPNDKLEEEVGDVANMLLHLCSRLRAEAVVFMTARTFILTVVQFRASVMKTAQIKKLL